MSEMSFEEAFQALEEAVQRLEAGNLTLEESLALFEQGTQLAAYCSRLLDAAELRVRQVTPSLDGEYEEAPLDVQGDWEA